MSSTELFKILVILHLFIGVQIAIIIGIVKFVDYVTRPKTAKTASIQSQPDSRNKDNSTQYANAYSPKWLMTTNEKSQYKKIKEITDKFGYTIFTKVRLADLIEPKANEKQTAFWKIQAKHVDFVICNEYLVARWVIEIQDSTHNEKSRVERDSFVRNVLTNCGYKVLETYAIQPEQLLNFLGKSEALISDEIRTVQPTSKLDELPATRE